MLSQDSDPFNLLPIIEAVSKGGLKRSKEAEYEDLGVCGEDLCVNKAKRSAWDQTEATPEGSPRSQ